MDISCGQHHTVVVTDKAEVYVFGANNYGQLGIDNELFPTISVPTKLTNVHFNLPIETHTGWTHTVILTGIHYLIIEQDQQNIKLALALFGLLFYASLQIIGSSLGAEIPMVN